MAAVRSNPSTTASPATSAPTSAPASIPVSAPVSIPVSAPIPPKSDSSPIVPVKVSGLTRDAALSAPDKPDVSELLAPASLLLGIASISLMVGSFNLIFSTISACGGSPEPPDCPNRANVESPVDACCRANDVPISSAFPPNLERELTRSGISGALPKSVLSAPKSLVV